MTVVLEEASLKTATKPVAEMWCIISQYIQHKTSKRSVTEKVGVCDEDNATYKFRIV